MLNQMDQIIHQGLMTDLTPVATTSTDVAPPTVERTSQEESVFGVLQPTLAAGTATKPAVTPNPKNSNRITHATVVKSPGRAVTASLQPPDTTPGISGHDTLQYPAQIVDQTQSLQPEETNSSLQTQPIVTPSASVNLDDQTQTLPVVKMQGRGLRDKKANVRLEQYHLSPDG